MCFGQWLREWIWPVQQLQQQQQKNNPLTLKKQYHLPLPPNPPSNAFCAVCGDRGRLNFHEHVALILCRDCNNAYFCGITSCRDIHKGICRH